MNSWFTCARYQELLCQLESNQRNRSRPYHSYQLNYNTTKKHIHLSTYICYCHHHNTTAQTGFGPVTSPLTVEHSTIELLSIYIGAYVCILTIKMFIRKGVMPQYVLTQT